MCLQNSSKGDSKLTEEPETGWQHLVKLKRILSSFSFDFPIIIGRMKDIVKGEGIGECSIWKIIEGTQIRT